MDRPRVMEILQQRVRQQEGFGLVELLIAMSILTIALMGIAAAFSAGILAVDRASRASTAGTIADVRMERYRAAGYNAIALTCGPGDPAAAVCVSPAETVTGADGRTYLLDVSVGWTCALPLNTPPTGTVAAPSCAGQSRPSKLVTLVVRNAGTPSKVLFRESSTFELALG